MTTEEQKAKRKAYAKAYYEANKRKINKYNREHYAASPAVREKKKSYESSRKEWTAEVRKAYYEANREKLLAYSHAYYLEKVAPTRRKPKAKVDPALIKKARAKIRASVKKAKESSK